MNSKHRKTLEAVFAKPTTMTLEWSRIEALLVASGCQAEEGRGSRVRFIRGDLVTVFHRPHPQKEAKAYQVEQAREFLESIGVKP
ncbi:HicA protein [Thiomonas sp. X19]|uniref:type II toxin-antitoxin system HicA family toxin n=1 Tax=Thiomonas sp. X19 TaxID=1050370 RepID=UPI000B68E802|nr:type II toxin-antitoxin system HicA family toxin [Thiomonas sp. X19]SCC93613.1 HicA protein [Thiomonas sp. X19]